MPSSKHPPLGPEAAAVVRALSSSGRLSRRSLLGSAGVLGLGAGLAGCGTSGTSGGTGASAQGATPKPPQAKDVSDTEKTLAWANWTLYIDKNEDSKTSPTLMEFTKSTGITVNYQEEVEDNDSFYGKHQGQWRQGQDFDRDLVVFTDWMASRVVKAGWVQKLDKKNIPNGEKNLLDTLKNIDYDPGRNYSLTWQSGYTGLGWNVARLKALTGKTELRTLDELWDPKLKGRIEVLSDMRDTVGLIMKSQNVKVGEKFTTNQFDAAMDVLEKQLSSGQIRQVKGNSYKEDLVSGDAVAAICWSGDIFQLNSEAKGQKYGFALPESGGLLWNDNMIVPIGARHKSNAEILMNYYYDPAVAAKVAAYVNYICPVKGAQEEIAKLKGVSREIVKSPYIFPTAEDLGRVEIFRSLSTQEERDFTGIYQEVLGA
ncbi:MAG: spermidine/putrescine transport system substrate-binding protein [Actinomycetota bacterium]|nr:spermidine/putrescine transport system substrate-binding protein [Actinomycetota bacterium]